MVTTEGITPREAGGDEEHVGEAQPEADGAHEHGQFDPHVWHDVANAIVMVGNIRDALVAADPARAELYERTPRLHRRTGALDASIASR